MQIEERTYYEEEQKMEAKWILIFILVTSLSMVAMVIALMNDGKADYTSLGIVIGSILFSDAIIYFVFKLMKLNLAISKKGLHYKMTTSHTKNKMISWDEVSSLGLRKSPTRGYGRKYKFRYGEVYTFNLKQGVELSLKNGKKIFFSLKDPDEFMRVIKKLELNNISIV